MTGGYTAVVTANGDVYAPSDTPPGAFLGWVRRGNVFTGGPTPAAQPSFGQLKARYR